MIYIIILKELQPSARLSTVKRDGTACVAWRPLDV